MELLDSLHVPSSALLRILVLTAGLVIIYALVAYAVRWLNRLTVRKLGRIDLETRARLRSLSRLIRLSVLLVAVLILLDVALKVLLADKVWAWVDLLGANVIRILTVVILALLAYWLTLVASVMLPRLASDEDATTTTGLEQRAQTVSVMLRRTGVTVIGVVAVVMILSQLGIDVAPILAGAGIVGLAIGFGAQTLVKDILSGFFIIVENRLAVGDYVTIGGHAGTVEKVALRTTALRALDGTLHFIPNGDIRTVSNRNKFWARSILKVRVSYEADVKEVEGTLRDLAAEVARKEEYAEILLDDPLVLPMAELNETWVTTTIVLKTKAGQQWDISRDLRERILVGFRDADVQVRMVGSDLVHDAS